MYSKPRKMNFIIEESVSRDLQILVPRGARSKLVNEALKKELARIRREALTSKLLKLRQRGPKLGTAEIVRALQDDRKSH